MAKRHPVQPDRVKTPTLRTHSTGQAFIEVRGERRYLGAADKPETLEAYHRAVAFFIRHGRLPEKETQTQDPDGISIVELAVEYLRFARGHYVLPDGSPSTEYDNMVRALKIARRLFGHMPAGDFGPLKLATVRDEMIRQGWARGTVNAMVGRLKRVWRWAVANEMVPPTAWQALSAVAGLRRGRTAARDCPPVRPVDKAQVEAVYPYVAPQVKAMIELQVLTAARAGEIVIMRRCDIDDTGKVWLYRPAEHKNAWRDRERIIYLGPQAQAVLQQFLVRPMDAWIFSPSEAEEHRLRLAAANRRTPPGYGNARGTNRVDAPKVHPGERYTVASYRRAIARACDKAFPLPPALRRRIDEQTGRIESAAQWRRRLTDEQLDQAAAFRKAHRWHPHRLRHSAATELRRQYGLDTARVVLGHTSPNVTAIYAEADHSKAIAAMLKSG